MEFDKRNIGKNIRYYRLKNHLSIDELAAMLDLSSAFIGLIERGQRGAKLSNLIKLAAIFGIDLNELIYGNQEEQIVSEDKEPDIRLSKVNSLQAIMYDMTEKEIDFVLSTIRNVKKLRDEPSTSENN